MDIEMEGVSGLDTTKKIRLLEKERGCRAYIIGQSGHGEQMKGQCIDAGMDDYLGKPLKIETFLTILSRLKISNT